MTVMKPSDGKSSSWQLLLSRDSILIIKRGRTIHQKLIVKELTTLLPSGLVILAKLEGS